MEVWAREVSTWSACGLQVQTADVPEKTSATGVDTGALRVEQDCESCQGCWALSFFATQTVVPGPAASPGSFQKYGPCPELLATLS